MRSKQLRTGLMQLGEEGAVLRAPWPKSDPELAKEDELEIAVQINGKLVTVIRVAAGVDAKTMEAAALAAQADYTYFLTWEDSSTQNYSPAQYSAYISPEIRAFCDLLRPLDKGYVQHACGHVKKLVPLMKADGVAAVESISSPPTGNITMKQARAYCGDTMGIVGGIEPTAFLDLSEAELVPYVEGIIADTAGGPLVLANSDSCPPGVTPEKFALVAGIAKRYQ